MDMTNMTLGESDLICRVRFCHVVFFSHVSLPESACRQVAFGGFCFVFFTSISIFGFPPIAADSAGPAALRAYENSGKALAGEYLTQYIVLLVGSNSIVVTPFGLPLTGLVPLAVVSPRVSCLGALVGVFCDALWGWQFDWSSFGIGWLSRTVPLPRWQILPWSQRLLCTRMCHWTVLCRTMCPWQLEVRLVDYCGWACLKSCIAELSLSRTLATIAHWNILIDWSLIDLAPSMWLRQEPVRLGMWVNDCQSTCDGAVKIGCDHSGQLSEFLTGC